MSLLDWIKEEQEWVFGVFEKDVYETQVKDRMTERPGGDGNSIAWMVWHIARTSDAALACIRREPQVFEAGGWGTKIGTDQTRQGTGFGDEEVAAFGLINMQELVEYWRTVSAETAKWLSSIEEDALDQIIDVGRLETESPASLMGLDDGLQRYFKNKDAGYLLRWPVILHGYMHVGEMMMARGILERSAPPD